LSKAPDAFRTISEVAEELDLPQHVLRFWESRFPQIKPMKRGGGRRYYRPEDVDLLRGVRHLLYGQGYTIRGVQRILREQGPRFVQGAGRDGASPPADRAERAKEPAGSPSEEGLDGLQHENSLFRWRPQSSADATAVSAAYDGAPSRAPGGRDRDEGDAAEASACERAPAPEPEGVAASSGLSEEHAKRLETALAELAAAGQGPPGAPRLHASPGPGPRPKRVGWPWSRGGRARKRPGPAPPVQRFWIARFQGAERL
jgi:DNA-binding transcriptional MerR regulator